MNTTADIKPSQGVGAATMPETKAEPLKLLKRIGSTVYSVNVRFSETSKETLEDKILRLIYATLQEPEPKAKVIGKRSLCRGATRRVLSGR
jgi:hypothetical protein